MGEENRVLTLDECMKIPQGASVYVEDGGFLSLSGIHVRRDMELVDVNGPYTIGGPGHLACNFRVWLREPTAEELAANPWPTPIAEV